MIRALEADYRRATVIKAGDEVRPVHGDWVRVDKVQAGDHIILHLADGQDFHIKKSHTIWHRRRDEGISS